MSEPTLEIYHGRSLANRLARLFAATRPAFLTASILPVVAAAALAWSLAEGAIAIGLVPLAVINIALVHSGANVLNDYFDALNGTDGSNTDRIYPFSGGSRFIQNKVLTIAETRNFGAALLVAGLIMGLWMTSLTGPLLLAMGLIGGLIAVVYSGPPCLACRGLGDIAIAACFGVLPVAGTAYILLGEIPRQAWWLGAAIGCFVAAILWVNSIPDIAADRRAGKLTIPARLGARAAARALPLWFAAGYAILFVSPLPQSVWIALFSTVPAAAASRAALAGKLVPAMPLTIVTHAMVCLLVALGLILAP